MNKSKRDEKCNEYMHSYKGTNSENNQDAFGGFMAGYDAGYAEAHALAKVLVEALETYECENFCDIAGVVCTDKICLALEQYKKAME